MRWLYLQHHLQKNMKPTLLILIIAATFLLAPCSLFAQTSIEWQASPSHIYGEYRGLYLTPTLDGGYAQAGEIPYPDSINILVTKLNSAGSIQWTSEFGSKANNVVTCIASSDDGGLVLTGNTNRGKDGQFHDGKIDGWIAKLDSKGAVQWRHFFGGTGQDDIRSIVQIKGGETPEYIFVGISSSNDGDVSGNHILPVYNDNTVDAWVGKINSTGDLLWQKSIGGSQRDEAFQIIKKNDSTVAFVGWTTSGDGDLDSSGNASGSRLWVVQLRGSNIEWSKAFKKGRNEQGMSLCVTSDGGYFVAGNYDTAVDFYQTKFDKSLLLLKLTSTGELEWIRTLGGSEDEYLNYVTRTSNNSAIAIGSTLSDDGTFDGIKTSLSYDVCLVKFSSLGDIQWIKTLGGTDRDIGYSIYETSPNKYIFSASTESHDGDIDPKRTLDNNSWIVALANSASVTTKDYELACSVQPQPAIAEITLRYSTASAEVTTIELTSLLGKVFLHTTDNSLTAGEHTVVLHLDELGSGSYILKLQTGNKSIVRKIVKL
jgi:hypothetical protein